MIYKKHSKDAIEFFVSPEGCDAWSGTLAQPNIKSDDGPLATFATAQKKARRLRSKKGFKSPVRITLRGGTYFLEAPILLQSEDSGVPRQGTLTRGSADPACPLTIAAYPGETPVLSGGRRITGWSEETVNGRNAWVASIADVKRGAWNFRQLWVNGRRRYRAHLPRQGRFQIAGTPKKLTLRDTEYNAGKDRFFYAPGDLLAQWRNLSDVEILFPNFWIDQRVHIRRIDDRRRLVVFDRPTHTRLVDDSWTSDVALESCLGFYWVENVFEALEQPGEWYLDRVAGRLYYLPLPDENIRTAEVIAPRLEQVVRIEGDSLDQAPAQEIRFEGITFSHTEWTPSPSHAAAGIQSACDVTGAVRIRNALTVDFHRCVFVHVGGYALECAEATRDIGLIHCELSDIGAGGVKVWRGCNRTTVSDCHIHDGGRVYESGVGVFIGKASGNLVLHNEVHDFGYSGISVGWDWSDGESSGYGNVIEYNHIYNIGRRELSDLGGIYTLGVAPGTRIRYNLIHDIRGRTQYAWGIYLDASSSYVLVENNVVFRADDGALMMGQSRNHVIRNNIFALSGKYQLRRHVIVAFSTCTFEHNIVYSASSPLWVGEWKENRADLHHNLYFAANQKHPDFAGMSFRQWQKRGLDNDSIFADPKFRDPENGDFRLAQNSPAFRIGFVAFDLAAIGPRPVLPTRNKVKTTR